MARTGTMVVGALVLLAACGGDDSDGGDPSLSESVDGGDVAAPGDDDTAAADTGEGDTNIDTADTDAADLGEPVSVVGFEAVEFDGPVVFEVSPDGRRIAVEDRGRVCLHDLDVVEAADGELAAADAACSGEIDTPVPIGRWSPDGTRFVFGVDTFRMMQDGPIVALGVDGDVTTIAEPPQGDDAPPLSGAPFFPVFVDDDTVAFGRLVGDPWTFEVSTVSAGGGDERVVASIPNPDPTAPWMPRWTWEIDEGDLLVTMGGVGDVPVSLWILDLDSGTATEVDAPPSIADEGRRPTLWSLHDRSGSFGIAGALDVVFTGGGSVEAPAWWLLDLDGGSDPVGLVVDTGNENEQVRHAVLSPDGATVAVLVGDLVTTSVALATAPTADVVAGTAEWASVALPDGTFGAADFGQSARALSWSAPDALVLKSAGVVIRFDVE